MSKDIELSYELRYQIIGNLQEIIHSIHQNAKLEGHGRDVLSVAFSPNDKMIASGSGDETIKLWNAMNGEEILTLRHPKGVRSIAFSPDGTKLASTSGGPDIKLWNVADGQELLTFYTSSNYINEITFRPDGKRIASAGNNGVELWSVSDGKNMGTWGTPQDAYCVAFSSDSKRIAAGFEFNDVTVWNLANGELLMNLNIATLPYSQIPSMLTNSIAFSPTDENILAVADSNGVIIIDIATMQTYQLFEKSRSIRDIKFSPDGKTLLCGASDSTVQLWDILDRVEVFSLPLHQGYVSSVDFNSDGTVFVSGSGDETVAIGYSNAYRKRNFFEHQSGGVLDVHFSPDDKFLVSMNGEETVFWNVLTGQRNFTVKEGFSSQIAISPNGKILAAPLSSEKGILLMRILYTKKNLRLYRGNGLIV